MKILVINGPNINMLGVREPKIYGTQTYEELIRYIKTNASMQGIDICCKQSNHEGDLVDWIQEAYGVYDGIIINPAAYTHTSIAIADALKAVGIPTIEVHLTNPDNRESYRHISYIREACIATIAGMGFESYAKAIELLIKH